MSTDKMVDWVVTNAYKRTGYSNAIARRRIRRNARVVLNFCDSATLSFPDAAAEYNKLVEKCEVVVWRGIKAFVSQTADCPMSDLDGAD